MIQEAAEPQLLTSQSRGISYCGIFQVTSAGICDWRQKLRTVCMRVFSAGESDKKTFTIL